MKIEKKLVLDIVYLYTFCILLEVKMISRSKKSAVLLFVLGLLISIIAHSLFIRRQILYDTYMGGLGDQTKQMYVFKSILYNEFKEGNFFYSFNFQGGSNILTRLSYYYSTSMFFYVTAFISFLLEKIGLISTPNIVYWAKINVIISIIRMFLIITFTTKYIEIFEVKRLPAIIGATIYSTTIMYFRNVALWEFFSDAMIWLPIILYGIEMIFRDKETKYIFSIGVGLTVFNNGYFAYINLLFCFAYIIFRYFSLVEIRKAIPIFSNLAKYGIIGFLIGLPGFIPFLLGFIDTNRGIELNYLNYITFKMGDFLFKDFSIIVPTTALLMFFFINNWKYRKFRFFAIFSFLLLLVSFIPMTGSIFNGFSVPENRYHYTISLMIGVMSALGIDKLATLKWNKISVFRLIIATLFTLVLYNYVFYRENLNIESKQLFLYLIILVFSSGIIAFSLRLKEEKSRILLFTLLLPYFVALVNQQSHLSDHYGLDKARLEYYEEFYRKPTKSINLGYKKWNEVGFHRIASPPENRYLGAHIPNLFMYSSFLNPDAKMFERYHGVKIFSDDSYSITQGLSRHQILNSIMRVNLLAITDEYYGIPKEYSKFSKINDFSIYVNKYPLAFIHPVKKLYSYDQLQDEIFKQEFMISGAIIENPKSIEILERKSESIDYDMKLDDGMAYEEGILEVRENTRITLYINNNDLSNYDTIVMGLKLKPFRGENPKYFKVNGVSRRINKLGAKYNSQIFDMDLHIEPSGVIEIDLGTNAVYEFEIKEIRGFTYDELRERSQNDQLLNYDYQVNKDSVDISFQNEQGYPFMVLPIYNERGWQLKINGNSEEIITANGGQIGFFIPQGEVRITLEFHQPFFYMSILAFTAGLVLLIFYSRYEKNNNKSS